MKCSIKGCLSDLANGDLLFCSNHRFSWREYCDRHLGGKYIMQNRSHELVHLGLFQGMSAVDIKREKK